MTDLATGPVFTDDYWRAPFAVLGEVREQAPVREVDLPDGGTTWLVTRYADARAVMADPRFVKDFRNSLPEDQRASFAGIPSPGGDMMLLNDPPVHTRLRKLVVKAFTVRRVAALRPGIEAIATSLLTGLPGDAPVDLVEAYAVPLPTAVICELLGVPVEDQDAFGAWSRTLIDDSGEAASMQANASLAAYLAELVERKRTEPDEALISALIEVSEEGEQLSTSEIVAMGMLLLIAGHETTATLITTAVEAMLRDPGLRDRLAAADADELKAAIEEFLRWGSPIAQAPLRFAAEDVELSGVTVPRGAMVMVSLAAANHDPARFERPDDYIEGRDTTGHLAFGHGLHFCLGASLARLEAEVALRTLLDRFPAFTAGTDLPVDRRRSVLVNAWARLPVVLDGHATASA
ncbi:cytochrome P450 [Actinomycetospora sp. NBRC 106375]|uniref:cytochrome P450 family protein n=1 Tax=Actinomycetospora sp. NBRC 106375 TaxID=3032207 RepID=UPI0024A3A2AE|nr:cytochrome P450 [Actinomycetospora sp. NBRC 106375]GLZ46669.1 cytochrome P450 [Actinomycetospora sp. NBRC 106375]